SRLALAPLEPTTDDAPKAQIAPQDAASLKLKLSQPKAQNEPAIVDESRDESFPLPPSGGECEVLEAFNAYNETALRCGLPQARALTPDRRRRIGARLREYGPEGWCCALANLEQSRFLTG